MSAKLLIAAGGAAASTEDLPFGVSELIDAAEEILVITPTLPGRFEWLSSATDRAREQADERLQAVLGHLEEVGAGAEGEVGSDDPLEAIADAVRAFNPDHLLIALRAGESAGWQEKGLLDRVQERFALPDDRLLRRRRVGGQGSRAGIASRHDAGSHRRSRGTGGSPC